MKFEHDVVEADLVVAQQAAFARLVGPIRASWPFRIAIPVGSALAAIAATWGLFATANAPGPIALSVKAVIVGLVAILALVMLEMWMTRRAMSRRMLVGCGPLPYRQEVSIVGNDLVVASHLGTGFIPLRRVMTIEDGPSHVVIHPRAGFAVAVPRGAFASDTERNHFIHLLRQASGLAAT